MFAALASSPFAIEFVFAVLISEKGTLWLPMAVGCISTILGGAIGLQFTEWMSDNWYEFHRYYSEFRRD